jgi:hypothetical protein
MQQPTSNSCTYCSHHSHIRTKPKATAAKSTDTENDADKLNSPHLTPSQLIQRAHAQAIAAKVQEVAEIAPCRRPLLATGLHPPVSRSQPHPPPRTGRAAVQHVGGTSHRLDPISAAHEDMVAFNQAVAQGEVTSFIESVM